MTDLNHAGILGMKWGVRKTPHADASRAHTLKKKSVSELSNDEIKTVITRLSLEKQLSTLNPKTIGMGQKILGNLISKFGGQIVASFVKRYTKVDINDPFGTDDDVVNGEVIGLKLLKDKN